ncbi:MAG: hypothetical protein GY861_28285 [bacterium]|nr:hypothetical protein [bacterium]
MEQATREENIKYNTLPTGLRFHNSNARIRAMIGPVGCYSGDTEYYTPTGWRRFDKHISGGLIAQVDINTLEMSFVSPLNYVKKPCDEFIHFYNAHSVSMVLSDEHKMPLYDYRGNLMIKSAAEVESAPSRHAVPINFKVNGPGCDLSDADIRVMVMFCADGSINYNAKKQRVVVRKARKHQRIKKLLKEADIDYTIHPAKNRPTEIGYYFRPPLRSKHFTSWAWNMNSRQLEIVVDEMSHWDGLYEGPDCRFSTTHKDEADFMQYAVHATGGRATISTEKYKKENWSDCYIVHIAKKGSLKSSVMIRKDSCEIERIESEDGFKYCFSVPSGFLLVRHNGRIFISGNSGKTTAAAWDMCYFLPWFCFNEFKLRHTRWVVVRNCFDSQTEILTEKRGWQFFKNLNSSDKVSTRSKDGSLIFEKPSYYYQAPYSGKMIGIKSQNSDFLVTPDHNLFVSKRVTRKKIWAEPKHVKASDIYGRGELNKLITTASEWKGNVSNIEKDYRSKEFFEFLGFWFADGYAGKYRRKDTIGYHYRLVVTQNDSNGYVENLLDKNGFSYGKIAKKNSVCFNYSISTESARIKSLISVLSNYGKSTTKWLPPWVKNAPRDLLLSFLDGYFKGDGSRKTDTKSCDHLYTASKQLADDLQEVVFKSGRYAVINHNKTETTHGHMYVLTLMTPKRERPLILKSHWYEQQYEGQVYCVEVSTHVVYVRRNGKCSWSGQTYKELIDTTQTTIRDDWFPFGEYYGKREMYTLKYPNGPELDILFRACDQKKHVRQFKSLEITGYWIDESIEVSSEVKMMLRNRIGRYPRMRCLKCETHMEAMSHQDQDDVGFYKCPQCQYEMYPKNPIKFGIETTNPPDVEHSTYSEFDWGEHPPDGPVPDKKPKAGYEGFWQPPYENEKNLPLSYYKDLLEDYSDQQDWAEMYVNGKPGMIVKGKLVYNNFKRNYHVAKEPILWNGGPLFRGWDDSGNVPACLVVSVPSPGRIHILCEFCQDKMNIVQFSRHVVSQCNLLFPNAEWTDWDDPAGWNKFSKKEGGFTSNAQLIQEETGVTMVASEQNLSARLNAVDDQLALIDGILVDPECVRLINGFMGGYHYPEIGLTGEFSEQISKNRFSHIQDACQYVMVKLVKHTKKKHRQRVRNKRNRGARVI